jgi:type VI protein secretion system component Hcp
MTKTNKQKYPHPWTPRKEKVSPMQFMKDYDESHPRFIETLCSNFITSMKKSNRHMDYISGSDWLTVLINHYVLEINDKGISFLPVV